MSGSAFKKPPVATALLVAALLHATAVRSETTLTTSDSYIMGAGSWPCSEVLTIWRGDDPSLKGQIAGWVLGVWSRATTERERGFTDIVEQVGGQKILEATLKECSAAPPDTLLYRVSYEMIDNTNPDKN